MRLSRLSALSLAAAVIAATATPMNASAATLTPQVVEFEVADVTSGFTTWTVPVNICAIDIEAAGGNGGGSGVTGADPTRAAPGFGAVITTRSTVTPGQVLTIAVGETVGISWRGGAPGGGSTPSSTLGGGGGGWSGVATGAVPDQTNVLLVAAGGGGAGNNTGAHGGNADQNGATVGLAGGGGAGTDTAGGAGGVGGGGGANGAPGSALTGGNGINGGGGGGAGYFGGGGGSVSTANGGGGGGSSFPSATSPDRLTYRIKTASDPGDGWVTIGFDPSDPADTCSTPTASAMDAGGAPLAGTTVDQGDSFTVSGTDWPVGEQLTVSFESTPVVLGTVAVLPNGTFSFGGTVPALASGGSHEVVLTPAAATLPTFRFAVTVPQLAVTGGELPGALGLGLVFLVLGAALFGASHLARRTRRTHARTLESAR